MSRPGAFLLIGNLLLGSFGCRGFVTTHQVRQVIPSPSGRWKAVVTSWEPPGGALADAQYTIHVLPASDGIPMWMRAPWRGRAVWFSEFVFPNYVFWRDERSIVVAVDRPTGGMRWIRQASGTVAIETRVFGSSAKSFLIDLERLPRAKLGRAAR